MSRTIIAGLLVLPFALPVSAETLSVQVRDRLTGAPVANAIVLLVADTPVVRTVRTDANGDARIEVASKTVWLSIRSPRHSARCFEMDASSNGVLVADLTESVTLHGTVKNAEGRPVPDAVVRMSYALDPVCRVHIPPPPTRVDEKGQYLLRNVDPSRPFTIAVEAEGHERKVLGESDVVTKVDVAGTVAVDPDGQRRDLNVVLRRK